MRAAIRAAFAGGVATSRSPTMISVGTRIRSNSSYIDPGQMLFRGTQVRGWWLVQWFRTATPERHQNLFRTLIPLVAQGVLRAPVAAEYDLADVREAVAAAEGSERKGKILLVG
jgi:mitochondrial enoyl-[acyl-carrier protein] reductase / trans-2-enoyl-CoA reductase